MNLLHGIGFWIVLQSPYLALLEFLIHYCQVWFCFHLLMPIDVICANTFSSVFAMDNNLRLLLVWVFFVEEGVVAATMSGFLTVALIGFLFIVK